MNDFGELKIKQVNKSTILIIFDKVSVDGKKYVKNNIEKILSKNTLKAFSNVLMSNTAKAIENFHDFAKNISIEDQGTQLKISLNRTALREMSEKYFSGDMDVETTAQIKEPRFDFLNNFFPNNVFSVKKWLDNDGKNLREKYKINYNKK